MNTRIAAGDAFPAGQALFHDEAEGQGGNAQVNPFDAQRRQAHHRAHNGRQASSHGHTDRK